MNDLAAKRQTADFNFSAGVANLTMLDTFNIKDNEVEIDRFIEMFGFPSAYKVNIMFSDSFEDYRSSLQSKKNNETNETEELLYNENYFFTRKHHPSLDEV